MDFSGGGAIIREGVLIWRNMVSKNYYFCIATRMPYSCFNPLPDMPILGSSSLGANREMMSKKWTNRDTVI